VLIGSAENGNGIGRLLKALRHEAPFVETRARLGVATARSAVYVMKTFHTTHGGKLSLARVLTGTVADGATLDGGGRRRGAVSGVFTLLGAGADQARRAQAGDTVALGKRRRRQDRRDAVDRARARRCKVDRAARAPEPVLAGDRRPRSARTR
jgi:elongation factor G